MNSDSVMVSESVRTNIGVRRAVFLSLKRLFDILVGILGIILIIPLAFIIKAVSIINRDYEPIFFKQKRIGKDGKLFMMYKFRTMVPNADIVLKELMKNDESFRHEYTINKKVKNDPRITKVGHVLRRTSLDEIPQFINVFLGHMSLVGNRPYLPREKEDMGVFYEDIIKTKPGITGLWQTNGRSNTTFLERLAIEKEYSNCNGLKRDVKIIIDTIVQVVKKEGAE